MKITPKTQKGLSYEYHVVVAADEIEKQMEEELAALGKRVKVPGFRAGKIPMSVLRQKYGKEVMSDVMSASVNKATRQVLDDGKVRPAMQPDVKVASYSEGGDLELDISFEKMPDVPDIKYDSLTVEQLVCDVADEEIEEGLSRLAQSRKHTHKAADGTKAALGDVVKIDFLGKREGVPFDGGAAEGFMLELGSGQFIPGFEEQLVGSKVGDDVLVKVSFPESYHSQDLAGQAVTFDVKVHEVLNMHVPDISDALAGSLGFDDLAALRDAVRQQIGADFERASRSKAKKALFDTLDEAVKFDVPEKMLQLEFDSIWEQLQEAIKNNDPSVAGKSEADLKKEYNKIAERRVRLGILLSEVGRLNNIRVTNEELSRAVSDQARMFPGQERKVYEFYKKNPQHVDELRGPILEEKAVDYILSKVKRAERKVSVDDLFRPDDAPESEGQEKKASSGKGKKKTAE